MAQTIEATLAAKAEALAYGATPTEFVHSDYVLEALGTDYADTEGSTTHGYDDPIAALQLHAALMQGRMNWARHMLTFVARTQAKIDALIALGDPHGQLPALNAQLASYQTKTRKAYGQFLYGLEIATQFDFVPAIEG